MSLAGTVVVDLMWMGTTAQQIIEPLTKALTHWGLEVVDEFSRASDGDWAFDAEMESLLKDIVHEIVAAARNQEQQAANPDTSSE